MSPIFTPKSGIDRGAGFFVARVRSMSRPERRAIVERDHPALSLSRQCRLLSIGRSSLYYEPTGESAETLALMRRIDELCSRQKVAAHVDGKSLPTSINCREIRAEIEAELAWKSGPQGRGSEGARGLRRRRQDAAGGRPRCSLARGPEGRVRCLVAGWGRSGGCPAGPLTGAARRAHPLSAERMCRKCGARASRSRTAAGSAGRYGGPES